MLTGMVQGGPLLQGTSACLAQQPRDKRAEHDGNQHDDRPREVERDTAEANRRKFGQSKVERDRVEAETEVADRKLDAHRLDKPDGEA